MSRSAALNHEFVQTFPEKLKDGTLYVSMDYATAAHRCCCGCGREVITPLSPTDWKLTYDGRSVSLYPSVGNWSFDCRSHYWIDKGKVLWADDWSEDMIAFGRSRDRRVKDTYYSSQKNAGINISPNEPPTNDSLWIRFGRWLSS
jgi:hypothetical protein